MMGEPEDLAAGPPRIEEAPPVLIAGPMRALAGKERHRVKIILRRMAFLQQRHAEMRLAGKNTDRDAAEYSALHWVLRRLGLAEGSAK